jgi:hypothetical protein
MKRFRKILLVEGDRRLTPEVRESVADLARRNDAEPSVLSVLTPAPRFLGWASSREKERAA